MTVASQSEISELALVRLANTDRRSAFRLIYARFVGSLAAVCSRYILDTDDAKDVLQESFLKIYASFESFTYRGEGSLKAWMSKIVVNETLRFISGKNRIDYTFIPESLVDTATDNDDDAPDLARVPASVIHSFIRELPDGYRMIFNLFVFEGKNHSEIARLLGISNTTSASQLHRARSLLARKIKTYLQNNDLLS